MTSLASADMLQINNPTDGTVWKTGVSNFVGWSGNCASMENESKMVKVDLVNGPSTAVRYVATLGTLDCSGSNTRADMTVPNTVPSGQYAIVVRTSPQQSYTNSFRIESPSTSPVGAGPGAETGTGAAGGGGASGASPTNGTTQAAGAPSSSGGQGSSSGARSMAMTSVAMLMLAGAAGLGFQLLYM
ncbi:hypothetical protein BGX31_002861 [Mortierella sp. GBA43]|nr:hypothetical protein BGX31_002861 [Mortierella sp. GBA43]